MDNLIAALLQLELCAFYGMGLYGILAIAALKKYLGEK